MMPNLQENKEHKKFVLWNGISLVLFFLMVTNTFYCSFILYNSSSVNHENQQLLRSLLTNIVSLQSHEDNLQLASERKPTVSTSLLAESEPMLMQKFDRLVDAPSTDTVSRVDCPQCPPCPGPPTNMPVSLIHNAYRERAKYTCYNECIKPPIHVSTLTIDGVDGSWVGRERNQQDAKHDAAYKAIIALNLVPPEDIGFSPPYYEPNCNSSNEDYNLAVSRKTKVLKKPSKC